MRRLMIGGLALGVTAAATLALGGPAGAQEEPEFVELQGTLSSEVAAPGEGITASSVEPCTVEGEPGELYWAVYAFGEYEVPEDEGAVSVDTDGSWSVDFTAPAEPGDYDFSGFCFPSAFEVDEEAELEEFMAQAEDFTEEFAEGEEPEEEPPFLAEYYYLPFTVSDGDDPVDEGDEPEAPGQPAPPTAAPAVAVPGDPDYTG